VSQSSKAADNVTPAIPSTPSPVPAETVTHLESLYIGRGGTLHTHAAAHGGSVASDPAGAFSFVHTFDHDVHLGGAMVLTCWIDAASAQRGRFCASLGHRAAPGKTKTRENKEDRPLPCVTGCMRDPGSAAPAMSARAPVPVSLTMTTTPAWFKAGDQLVLTLTLAAPRGSETVMHGVLYFGPGADSVLTFSVIP
jgi:hypothetical protein